MCPPLSSSHCTMLWRGSHGLDCSVFSHVSRRHFSLSLSFLLFPSSPDLFIYHMLPLLLGITLSAYLALLEQNLLVVGFKVDSFYTIGPRICKHSFCGMLSVPHLSFCASPVTIGIPCCVLLFCLRWPKPADAFSLSSSFGCLPFNAVCFLLLLGRHGTP